MSAQITKEMKLEIAKAKVAEILASSHVEAVEVSLEEVAGNRRHYSAITKDKGFSHYYTVRVADEFDGVETITTAQCTCRAGAKKMNCRHLIAVARIDAEKCGREIYPLEISEYRAYRNFGRKAEVSQ